MSISIDTANISAVQLTSGEWVEIQAGSYQEGERAGYTWPPLFQATTADGDTIVGFQRVIQAFRVGS